MQQRNRSSLTQCEFADRLERVANILMSRISGEMTPSHWEACQISLASFYEALAVELKERGRFHYISPAGSPHYCLHQAYKDCQAKLHILEQTTLPPPPQPGKPRSLTDVLKELGGMPDADNGE